MKKTILLTLALGFAASGIFAQSSSATTQDIGNTRNAPLSAEEKAKDAADKIAAQAKLNFDQRNQVYTILNDYYAKAYQIRKANGGKDNADVKSQIAALQNSLMPKFKAILSDDQMNTVKAMYSKPETK